MRKDLDFFGEQTLQLVHVAKRLKDAERLEALLTERQLDYHVESDTYWAGYIFRTQRVGAFFYVAPDDADTARELVGGG